MLFSMTWFCWTLALISQVAAQNNRPATDTSLNDTNCGRSSVRSSATRIVNGQEAEEGEFPWQATLLFNDGFSCGATILNRRWLLTAAHCFEDQFTTDTIAVEVGNVRLNSGQRFSVSWDNVFIHHSWDPKFHNDVTMIKTNEPMPVNSATVNTICLPGKFEEPRSSSVVVTGWGETESSSYMDNLQEVQLNVISDQRCEQRHAPGVSIWRSEFCTWTQAKDACTGDSGGPAIEYRNGRAFLVGVTSWGSGCANEYPGVFAQVSHFIDWIQWTLRTHGRRKRRRSNRKTGNTRTRVSQRMPKF